MILHTIRLGRSADDTDLTDLTASTRTGAAVWFACEEHGDSNCLNMPLTPEPSEVEARTIRRRLVTADAEEEQQLTDTLAAVDDPATPTWALPLLRDILSRFGE